jgi:hypothetical protein
MSVHSPNEKQSHFFADMLNAPNHSKFSSRTCIFHWAWTQLFWTRSAGSLTSGSPHEVGQAACAIGV